MLTLRIFLIVWIATPLSVIAAQVDIRHAEFTEQNSTWTVSTTLHHIDTGWEEYADAWRIVTVDGHVLATRVLYHPHVDEQPFTRSLNQVRLPPGLTTVFIEAHCKAHGWSNDRLQVYLTTTHGPRYRINRSER
jgi:hypothetical protein